MGSKRKEKKIKKINDLFESAYELLITKGLNNTSISEIVKEANVAKGTFYLYFKDKYDLSNKLIIRKSSQIINFAFRNPTKNSESNLDLIDEILVVVNSLIDYFNEEKELLKLIHKDLVSGLQLNAISGLSDNSDFDFYDYFINKLIEMSYTKGEAEKILYLIMELVSSTLYTTIVLETPYKINEIKPTLFETIRKIIKK